MGKMKIKVKPEGAKLIFTGGDLDVDLHPAHGYVRPIHNVIISHAHHDEHHDEHHEDGVQHHEIEHDEEEDHSGHHEWHHSYHHDEHGGHDDDGYGFRYFHHWPNSLHGEHEFLGHDFYHDGDHHGHFRDEINDGGRSDEDDKDDGRMGTLKHQIMREKDHGNNMRPHDDITGQSRTIDNLRSGAIAFGSKFPYYKTKEFRFFLKRGKHTRNIHRGKLQ